MFILIFAILLKTGATPPTITHTYDTREACMEAGEQGGVGLSTNDTIQEAKFMCLPVSFGDDPPEQFPEDRHS